MAGTDFGVNFGAGVVVNIVTAVGRQACYCYKFNELVTELRVEQENLISTRNDMQRQLDKGRDNTKEPAGHLQLQLKEAKDLIDKVDMLKGKAEAKQSCCHGVCPNWICRYVVGKKAEKKTEVMKQLNEKLRQKLLSAHRLSLRCMRPSEDFILFNCTKEALNEILMALMDDKKIRIGLNGMGGCGKTSLLREVHKEVADWKLYKIAFVDVSNPSKDLDIQDSIANWIGLVFETEKNVPERAARLSMAFEEDKKYLVILDNVWQVLNFEAIGIPVGENCKVLLSTRQRHIFYQMKFDAVIDLSLLTKEEAWKLFQKHAGEIEDQQLAQQIADECHRLPVAIKAVASTLRGKGHHVWIDALVTLQDRSQPLNIEGGMENPYKCLKFSLDLLKENEELSLYLLCSLFPNDSEIAVEDLIRFAFGLGIFLDINSYRRARPKVRTAIDKFKDYCLLLQVQEGRYVKLHDMFHSLALWKADKKTQVIMGPTQIVALTKADYMKCTSRLYCHDIKEFPDQLNCPELEILVVSNNGGYSSKFPDAFFKGMMKLKVLAIKNTSFGTKPDLVLPPSIQRLKELQTLCLRGWTLLDISMFEKFKKLDTLELLDCVMEELPDELENLESLKLLQVSNCKIGGNPYKVLATCLDLEELYFVENQLPKMVQIGRDASAFFDKIKVLQRYHLEIGGSINTSKDQSSSKLISINNFDASIRKEEAFQELSKTLEVLLFEKIQGDCESIIPEMFPMQGECLKELKEFVLRDSDCIKCLIDTTNDQLYQNRTVFAKLQNLKVEAMECLKALCHGPPPSGLFEKLKELFITNCSQLESLFTTTTAQKMVMLEVLEVIDCGKLRYMITVENNDEDISVGPVLPKLKQISVKRCHYLKCILPISVASGLLQLETLEIEDAAELQYVFGKDNHEKHQSKKQISIDLPAVEILKLINLPIIISICPRNYDMKLPMDKVVTVTGCPLLSGISKARQEDGNEAMKQAELLSMSSGEELRFNARGPRRAHYFYRFNTFVTDLSKEKDLLISKLSGDQQLVGEEARDLIEKVEMLEREAEASKSCFYGVFPNCLGRYSVGKSLEQMTETVKQFHEGLTVAPIHVPTLPWFTPRNNVRMFESRKRPYDEILLALKDDEIYMIGLCGMGGCGKTSLIKEVCIEVENMKLFDMVAFVSVSQQPNIRRIQCEIAEFLGLSLEEMTEIGRATKLSTRLTKGDKILIILDDIWQVLKLEDVGIPLGKNCKLVLTTRLQEICFLMDCEKMVYLSPLSEEEAWILFQEHTGVIQDTLKHLVLQILRECHGLPIAIITVARALKDRPGEDWKKEIMRLGNHETNISSGIEMVYQSLKLSIDHLGNDEVRSLFFLCALFPEDSDIALEILIRFAFGLGIFKDIDSYERARIGVYSIMNELIDSSLMLLVDKERQYFRMHDLVREVALNLAKKIQVIMGPEENLIALTERDYMKDTTRLYCHDINEYPNQLSCPKLEFLFVSNGGCLSEFSDTFFIEMIELKVLAIIDTSIWTTPNLVLPQSMDGLKKLRTVCLRGWTLNNISILGKLEMLDTIELLYCVIKELPEELAELRTLSLLEVSGCEIGSNPFEVLAGCSQLEELYFVENSVPEMVSNDHNVVKLLHQIGSSKVLRRYRLQIGTSIHTLENNFITKFMSISGFNMPTSNEEMKNMAPELEVLFLENVQGGCKNISPDMIPMDEGCMNKLKEFLLHDSDNIECLIDMTNRPLYQATTAFSKLLKLKIKVMKCFKALCRGPTPFDLFEELEELFIVECSQLHYIVSAGKLNFCSLKHLQLEGCPRLTSIFTYSTARTMVSLKILKVRDCISLKHIIKDEEEDHITPGWPILPSLKQVCVKGCQHLEFVIPASFLVGGFSPIESLEIEDASLLKHVFGKYEREEGQNQSESNSKIDFPFLEILKLVDLPNITSVCPQNYLMRWPDVTKLYIKGCPLLSITSDLDSEAIQQGGRQYREQDWELPEIQSSDMVERSLKDIHPEESKMEGIFQLTKPAVNMESKSLSLSCLQSLVMENLPNLTYIYEDHKKLLNLRRVKIYRCGELKCIFSLRMMTYISALHELIIEDCSQLEQIIGHEDYDGQDKVSGPFSDKCNLQKITVKACPMLGSLFTVSTGKTLRLMRTLKIEECPGMEVLLKDESAEEDGGKAIFPNLSFLSLKNLPEFIRVFGGGKLKAVKGVMFPESFNLSNLQRLTVKSCPRLRSLFTVSTAKTLMWLNSLEIIECSGLDRVVKGKSKEIAQGGAKLMLPKLNILHLVKLPSLIIILRGIKLQCELCHVHECPNLKQTVSEVLKPDDLLEDYESPEEEEDCHYKDEDMDRREEQRKEVECAILEDNSNVIEQSCTSCQEIKEVGNPSADSLLPTITSGSREIVAIHQDKEVQSHTGSTCSKEDKDKENKTGNNDIPNGSAPTGSNFHLLNRDGTDLLYDVQVAAEVPPHSQESKIVDTQEGLQKEKFCPDHSKNLRESSTEIVKGSLHKDPAQEESTVGSSSQVKLELLQAVVDPQQVVEENKVSLPLPVDPTVFSPSTSITTTPLTSEAATSSSTNQQPPSEELVDFHGLFKIKERRALLLDEAFVKYPHLWEWKLSQRTLRIFKVGYESLADMLTFLESETPKTMDNSKMEEFENLYYELEYFGFDEMWLASVRQRVMDMQADRNNKLKQLDQLESQISTLEEQLSDARASLASVKDDLSKPCHVFGF